MNGSSADLVVTAAVVRVLAALSAEVPAVAPVPVMELLFVLVAPPPVGAVELLARPRTPVVDGVGVGDPVTDGVPASFGETTGAATGRATTGSGT
ncbi:MAG TPA: hypothetical protein VFR49_12235, partial [Solirubrobacteraceae bacterium]|nr:hypothetical protein [Solirubrobacteraceae bacterium]